MKKTLESWLSMLLAFMLLLSYVPALGLQAQAVGDPDDEEPALETTSTNTLYDDFVNGLVPEEYPMSYPKLPLFAPFSILPSSYDARAYNYISSVKNQGSNGLCWAFAAYGIVESNLLKSTQGERDLSELHMGYATSDHSGNTQGYSRTPGGGGNRVYAASYLMRGSDLSGTVAEANDPYITSILQDRDLSITKGKPKNYTVQDVIFLNGESKESILSDTIKEAIMQYGAVAASMYWDGTATADVGPGNTTYYKASTASYYYYNSPAVTNHAVTIIGWNDNYSKSNFNETYPPSNNGAWLVKNSWDTDWGNYGYFWISYEDTTFPLSAYVIDGVTAYDASSTVYEDDYKSAGTYGYSNSDVWYTEVFSALSDSEQLDNVKVYFTTSNITVSIYATSNFDGTSTINKSTPSASRYIEYPGWYTFKFSNPVTLGAIGSAFAVAVRINASEVSNNRIAYSTDPKINSTYTARGSSPTSWTTESYNFCIKAVTSANTNAVSSVASALTWDSIRDNNYGQSFVADNLVTPLPTSGEYGTSISWTSSNPSVLSTTGIVSRVTSNIPVTLTATVSKGSESQQVIFNLTVLAEPANAYEAIQQAKLILTWDAIKGANTLQNSVEKNLVLPTTGINGTTISWHSSNPQISDNGVVTVDTKITGILTGNFTATITKGSTSDTADFPLTVKITDNIKPQASAIAPTGQFLDIGTVTNLVLKFSETVEAIAGKTITIAAYEKIFAYNTDGSAYPIRGTGNFAFTYTIPSSPNIISGFGNECIATIPISAFGNLVTFGTSPSYYNNINASLNKLQDNFRTYCLFVSTDAFLDLSGNSMPHLITYSSVPSYSQYDVFFSKTKVAPAVSSVVPASGSTNTPTSGTISVTFSKQMDKLVPGTISLNSSATSGGSWSSDGTVYTVNYTGLAGNTAYTINISGFSDPDGNIMTANSSYSFTTAASAPVELYNIIYHDNGGYGGPATTEGLLPGKYELSIIHPMHVKSETIDVLFIGWSMMQGSILDAYNVGPSLITQVDIVDANVIVFAVWGYDRNGNGIPDVVEPKYTLTYNLNGGIGGPSPNPVSGLLAYDSYTLSMTKPTHADVGGIKVAFMGWTFAQDTKIYAKSEIAPLIFTSISIDGNKTVYAVWGYDENYNGIPDVFEELYSLTYNLNGGIDGPSPNPVTGLLAYDSYTLSMSKPTHADVSGVRVLFMGWKETLDTRIYAFNDTAPTIMSTIFINGNKTVYAVWGYDENANGIPDVFEETYDIIYDNNGGTGGPGVRAGLISGIYEISRPNPTHVSLDGDNVLFIGWSLTRSPILYVFDTTPTLAAYVYIANANVVLFAVWGYDRDGNGIADAFEGHITIYNPNGGTGGPGTIPGRLYGQYPLDAPNPTHASSDGSNVLFVGWSLMQISEILESYSAIPAMEGNVFLDGADVTLYAVWGYDRNNNGTADIGERKFSIIYNDNGGTGGPGTLAGRLAGTYAIAMPNPTHAPVGGNNVLFLGWSLTQISTILEATDTVPTLSSNVAISTANVTLYAVWRYDRGGSESIWAKVNGEPIENGGVYKSAVAVNKTNITATPGATIAIQKGGVAYTGANLTASNIYAVTISNAGITQIEFSIIVDTVKPTISVSPADNNGIVANNKWTNSDVAVTLNTSTTLISGTVRYQYGIPDEAGVVDENAWVDINGNVFTIPQPANDEITVNYKFRAISQTGIIGNATTKWTFNIDTIRPAYTVVTQKEAGFSGYGQNVVINFTEPVTLYYTLDGVEGSKKSTANENNSITLSTDGLYTAIRAVDKAGNLTVNNIEDITISKTKPSAVVVSPSDANGVITNSKWTNSDVIVDLSVTSSATVTYQYGVPDETGAVTESAWVNITGSTFKISKPTNGEITVNYKFRAISQTGVAGNASTKWTFNIDTIKPVFTIMTEKETGFNGYGQNVVINFTEPVTLHYKHDSVEDSKKSANNADNSVTLNAEGVYTTISATDKAGNLTTKNISSITINKTKPVITLDPSIPNNQKTNSNVIVKITATPETGLSMRYQVKEGTGGEWVTITTASGKNGATFVIPQKIASNTATYYFQAINNVSGVVSGQKTYKANITGGISVVFGSKVISLTNPQEFKPVYYFTSAISKAQITYSEAISALVIREYTVDSTLGDQVTALANNKKYSATVTIGSEEYHFDLVVDTVTPGAPIIAAVTSDESTYKSNTLTNSDIRINLSPAANYSGISGIYGYKYAEVEVTIDGEGKTVNEFIEDSKGVIWHDIVDSNGIPTDVFEVKAAQGESLLKRYKFKAVSNAELETNVANANSPFVVNIDKTELLWSIEPAAAAAEVVAGFDGYAANVNLYANKTGAQFGYKLDGVEVALKTVNVNTLAVSLTTNGSYTDIYVVDKAGNRKDLADKNGKPIEIVINKTRPTLGALVIDPPTATSGKLSTQDVTVALTVTNGVPAVYQYRIDDGGWLDIDGNVLVIMGPINTGKYTFRAVNAVSGIIGTGDKSYSANIKY